MHGRLRDGRKQTGWEAEVWRPANFLPIRGGRGTGEMWDCKKRRSLVIF
jgi:hypothetical protein